MFRLLLVVFLIAPLLASPVSAQIVTPIPATAAAGTLVSTDLEGLTNGARYRLYLEVGRPATSRTQVDDFTATATAVLRKFSVPTNATVGLQDLVLYRVSLGEVQLDTSDFTVTAGPVLSLTPNPVRQGRSLRFTMSPTRAGTLTIKFDGETVFGPITVGDGSYTAKFVVPRDRPVSVPSAVTVRAENRVGLSLVGVATDTVQVQGPFAGPAISGSFTSTPPNQAQQGSRIDFSGQLTNADGLAVDGDAHFIWKAADGRVVPIDGPLQMDTDGRYTTSARAPSLWLDGVGAGTGELVAVVADRDPDTDIPRIHAIPTGRSFTALNTLSPTDFQLALKLVGRSPLGGTIDIPNAYIEVLGDLDGAFTDPTDGVPPTTNRDALFAIDNQLSQLQASVGGDLYAAALNGCPITFARKFTSATGEALFEYDPEQLRYLMMLHTVQELGEIRMINRGMPVPGVDIWQNPGNGKGGIAPGDTVQITLRIHAGQQGYGEIGKIDEDLDPSTPKIDGYQPTDIGVELDLGTGQATLSYGPLFGGSASLTNNLLRVELLPITLANAVVPRNLRIQGLLPDSQNSFGKTTFEGMHSYPSATRFPDAVFTQRNVNRQVRFEWEAGFGAVQNAVLQLKLPGDASLRTYATFAPDTVTACNVSGLLDYVATFPDMTRLPVGQCFPGKVLVDRSNGADAYRMFDLCTISPPSAITDTDPQYTLHVNALARDYEAMFFGELAPTEQNMTVNNPNLATYNIPPQSNVAANAGDYQYRRTGGYYLEQLGGLSTDHIIASNDADTADSYGSLFGFDPDVQALANVDRITILDTGRIPLFRYPWGVPPIAGATLGADFWLASELGLYGRLGVNETSFVDASIDPSLAGGVDMFFDLDVLFGLVSASVTASPEMSLLLRDTIGRGGLFPVASQNAGSCFEFALDLTFEVCAVFCAEDTFNVFTINEGNACPVPGSTVLDLMLADRGKALTLNRPKLLANALAVDAYGRQLVVQVDSQGRLKATHLDAGGNDVVRTIAGSTQGLQHIEVAMFTNGRALAVWSESTLSIAQLDTLMRTEGVRRGTDNLARAQVLKFSRFDGTSWTAPVVVPTAQTGVGRPKLAVCKYLLNCNRVDVAYLVWEYDRNQNIENPDIEIWGSEWRNNTFSPRLQLSALGSSSDMGPAVAYLGSDPVVAWVHNPLGAYSGLAQRRIAYRIVDTVIGPLHNTVEIPVLPEGASWPSLAGSTGSTLYLAYTISTDGVSVLGNRNALQVAKGTCDGTRCTFENTEPRDPHGRRILGERPTIALDSNGDVVVGMRGLGYANVDGSNPARSDDLPGMLIGTGELISVRVPSFTATSAEVAVVPLSNNGLQHFRPQFAFDPAMDAFIGLSQEAVLPTGQTALDYIKRLPGAKAASPITGKALGEDLRLATLSDSPDLRVESVTVGGGYWQPSQSRSVRIVVRNAGRAFDPSIDGGAELRLSWDAPAGAGTSGDAVAIPAMAAGGELLLNRTAVVPANHEADELRSLFIDIVPTRGSSFDDARAEDNTATITRGEMPVPTGLSTRVKTESPIIGVDWIAPNDPRIAGYRVYKRAENGEYLPYGSTPVSSFADFFAGFRDTEHYRVTSYSARGVESALSEVVEAVPARSPALFTNGFE